MGLSAQCVTSQYSAQLKDANWMLRCINVVMVQTHLVLLLIPVHQGLYVNEVGPKSDDAEVPDAGPGRSLCNDLIYEARYLLWYFL